MAIVHESKARQDILGANGMSGASPSDRAKSRGLWRPTACALAAIAALTLWAQLWFWQMNPDTSWLITVIDAMHRGARLYQDVLENNTPISVWAYMPAMQLSYLTGMRAEPLVNLYTLCLCLAGIALTAWTAREGRLLGNNALSLATVLMAACVCILVGNSFSERDHLGAVLALPMLALAAWRLTGAAPAPRPVHWLVGGLGGGIIAAIKPYYVLVIVAVAAYGAWRRRDWRMFLLPEYLLAAALTAAYAAVFYVAYPAYFTDVLPLLRDTYMAFSQPLDLLLILAAPWALLPMAYVLLARMGGRTAWSDVLALAATVALVPYFLQGKGWSYHAYVATCFGSAALIVQLSSILCDKSSRRLTRLRSIELAALVATAIVGAHFRFLPANPSLDRLQAELSGQTASPTVAVLGGDIAVSFPLARLIDGRWAEPSCADWIGRFALRMENRARAENDAPNAARYAGILSDYLQAKRARFAVALPDILIVDTSDSLVPLMVKHYGFAPILERYEKIAHDGDIDVYKRSGPISGAPISGASS